MRCTRAQCCEKARALILRCTCVVLKWNWVVLGAAHCSVLHLAVLHFAVLYVAVLHWGCSNIAVHLRERSWPRPGSAELQLHSHCNRMYYTSDIVIFLKYFHCNTMHYTSDILILWKYFWPPRKTDNRNICSLQQKQYQQLCQKRKNMVISFFIFMIRCKIVQSMETFCKDCATCEHSLAAGTVGDFLFVCF